MTDGAETHSASATDETRGPSRDPATRLALPGQDPRLRDPDLDLDVLAEHWAPQARLRPMTAAEMRGADARAQRLGVPGEWLMEQAGIAVAAAARALMASSERPTTAPLLLLCGPGNNGGDGLVAARHLAAAGLRCQVVLLAGTDPPGTPDAARNWHRLEGIHLVTRHVTPRAHDVALFYNGIERAGLVVDAMLGTGVRGSLREPISTAVEVAARARAAGVPILAVDSPTAVDLTTGEPSDPVVHAHATITFHRPKQGLLTRMGAALAGRVLVAPIGIPLEADRG
jgi:ADP-dependent NAD(P)H-hydrate dehydratase / NAD(P)H-hydrate epimerase